MRREFCPPGAFPQRPPAFFLALLKGPDCLQDLFQCFFLFGLFPERALFLVRPFVGQQPGEAVILIHRLLQAVSQMLDLVIELVALALAFEAMFSRSPRRRFTSSVSCVSCGVPLCSSAHLADCSSCSGIPDVFIAVNTDQL